MQEQKINRREILKTLVMLSIPTILEEILSTLLQYVDTAMVGHLGEKATASVSVTTTYRPRLDRPQRPGCFAESERYSWSDNYLLYDSIRYQPACLRETVRQDWMPESCNAKEES